MIWDVVIIGAGAAGMMCAQRAAGRGLKTLLLEKNRKVGVKILMSGGTRCNLTQATDKRGIVTAFGRQGNFLHSALARLSPQDVVQWFADAGVPTKREETGKIFPVSDTAVDVQQAMLRQVEALGCRWEGNSPVDQIERDHESGLFKLATPKGEIEARQVVITTGGKSYPGCGTTGDGYAWAKGFGHSIVRQTPALVPLLSSSTWCSELSGVTLPDVGVQIVGGGEGSKVLSKCRDSFLFAHFGFSGPSVLNVSREVSGAEDLKSIAMECDFLPEIKNQQLMNLLDEGARTQGGRSVGTVVGEWLPKRVAAAVLMEAQIGVEKKLAELSKKDRETLVRGLKQQRFEIRGTRGFEKAEVTAGGVSLQEVDSRTMESKLQPGLFFAGEVLDLDGPIGGYNFQAAFSTGWLAAEALGAGESSRGAVEGVC